MPNNASDTRKLDQLGRVVIPKFVRDQLDLSEGDAVTIRIDGRKIIIEPDCPRCVFCGEKDDLEEYKGKMICRACKAELAK